MKFLTALAALACLNSAMAFSPRTMQTRAFARRAPVSNLNIPRISLPEEVTAKLDQYDLKNPNELSDEEYNTYSAAAIGGTLIFFVLPGAKLFLDLSAFFAAVFKDFAFSALIGGGLFAALALRPEGTLTGDAANGFGQVVLDSADKIIGSDMLLAASEDKPAK